jgi:hypothetical protein
VEADTYGHFPIVAGIAIAALGVEGVLETPPILLRTALHLRCQSAMAGLRTMASMHGLPYTVWN